MRAEARAVRGPMATLILVRHGETVFNAERRYQGRIDAPLTPNGVEQAKSLGHLLRNAVGAGSALPSSVRVYVSGSERAHRTAAMALPDLVAVTDPRLDELDFGVFDGRTYEENLAAHDECFRAWIADPAGVRPPEGETLTELQLRVTSWLDSLPPGTDVIAFSHGGPIRAALARLLGVPFEVAWRFEIAPGDALRLTVPASSTSGVVWPVRLQDPIATSSSPEREEVPLPPTWLASLIDEIAPADRADPQAVRARLDQLTKPVGSLGRLEDLALRIALMCGDPPPPMRRRAVLVLAADHGVAARGVSAYPAEVTAQMCRNYAAGGAAINAIARAVSAEVIAVDVGVAADAGTLGVRCHKVRWGTADLSTGPAMTRADALQAIRIGVSLVEELSPRMDVFALGEMGIGNTTAAAALTAALCPAPTASVVGVGTGVDTETVERKREIVERAVARIAPDADPIAVLAEVGGLEIAALVGVVLAAARARKPIVTDGFIATAAVLVAARIAPAALKYVIASHRSPERGHAVQLAALGLDPLLDLQMRLGEGTGAALALPIVEAASAVLREMSTFAGAGVSTVTPHD